MHTNILDHFAKVDPILHHHAKKHLPRLQKTATGSYLQDLCEIVISQQLSTTVADTIAGRFRALFPRSRVTVANILKLPHESLRRIGISNSKARYIRCIAEAIDTKQLVMSAIDSMDDDTVRETLLQVKGLGPWSAEMFLIFSLERPDIFSVGDLGLRRAVQRIYKLRREPSVPYMLKLSEKWSPYRSYASRVLWKVLDEDITE